MNILNSQNNLNTEPLNYWFDGQLRRISMQVARIFTSICYDTGEKDLNGAPILKRIPVRYALTNKQVANILKNKSENIMFTIPMMTIFLSSLKYAKERLQDPFHVDKIKFTERYFDDETKQYTTEMGDSFILERIMPVPYDLTYFLDIWTSNQLQKDQIVEQIIVLFNPGLQLQNSDNVFDWTALSELKLEDVNWSSRGLEINNNDLEITRFTFSLQTWISPPSILEKQKVINTIITNITDDIEFINESKDLGREIFISDSDLIERVVVTPGNHSISVEGNKITLLGESNNVKNSIKQSFSWANLLKQYGNFRPGISSIGINITKNIENKNLIIGTIEFTNEENVLNWQVDPLTLPQNTFPPIKAVINPKKVWVGNNLPLPSIGDRYLISEEIASSVAWPNFSAPKQSIIEWDGSKWNIVFNSETEKNSTNLYIILNLYNGKQLQWVKNNWEYIIDGIYNRGYWRILL